MNKLCVIFVCLIMFGCSSLRVTPRGCKNEGIWDKENGVFEDTYEKSYYAFFIDREINLKEIVDCKNLSRLKVEVERNFFFHYKVKVSFREE